MQMNETYGVTIMSVKPALFYTVKKGWALYKVIAITSVKRNIYYGREIDDNTSTHFRNHDAFGEFPDVETAQAFLDEIITIKKHFQPIIKDAQIALDKAYTQERRNIKAAEKRANIIAKHGATVKIGDTEYQRFTPYPKPVEDGSVRCLACGQIDEPEYHLDEGCIR